MTQRELGKLSGTRQADRELTQRAFDKSLTQLDALVQEFPREVRYRTSLADTQMHLGWFHKHETKDFEKALRCFEKAQVENERKLKLRLGDPKATRMRIANALQNQGVTYKLMGNQRATARDGPGCSRPHSVHRDRGQRWPREYQRQCIFGRSS